MSKISIDQVTTEIMKSLNEYKGVTEDAFEKGSSLSIKSALDELHSAHPAGAGKYGSWDAYNKDWTVMKRKRDKYAVIHNKNHYQLTHLLEKGHALRQGGRTQAFEHIAPVAEKHTGDELIKNIKKFL